MAELPTDLCYTKNDEWARVTGTVARVGVTAHAADALGDIVYVSLPSVGSQVSPGDSCAELESTKSVNDVYTPVAGVVTAVNEAIADGPEAINADPYGAGWLFEVEMTSPELPADLMDAAAYGTMLGASTS